ncbi:hypothetical protein LZ30DRAFT_780453 [Colletotrichum cereale]|nr:hypothetical protein LZ30DRAFT_780453 [Colletotrichum cereale]
MTLAGTMKNEMDFGFTLVGIIQPYKLVEAFDYFDSDMFMAAQLGREQEGPNAEVSIVGKGEITNAPPGLGTFGGGILTDLVNNAANRIASVGSSSSSSSTRAVTSDSVFAMNVVLEASMELKVFGYSTMPQEAVANVLALVIHAIRIDVNSSDVINTTQGGVLGVLQTGSLIQDGGEDGASSLTPVPGTAKRKTTLRNDGNALDDETGHNKRWTRANLGKCVDTFTTQLPLFTWDGIYNYFPHDYRAWVLATVNVLTPTPLSSGAEDMMMMMMIMMVMMTLFNASPSMWHKAPAQPIF